MTITRMSDLSLAGKRVLIREDLNAPVEGDTVTSAQRLQAALPTLRAARDAGARVMVMSHRGRPSEGSWDADTSLAPMAAWLGDALDTPIRVVRDYLDGVDVAAGEVVMLENCRMNTGEKADDDALAKRYAALCDVFVMDAFGTAHRAQASTHGVIQHAPTAAAGPLLAAELDGLAQALDTPQRPMLAIVGGSKVSSKLTLLENLLARVDRLIVGGGIANTFLAAAGYAVGNSLVESDLVATAERIMAAASEHGTEIPLPTDVVVAPEFAATAQPTVKPVDSIDAGEMVLDIGPDTAARYATRTADAGTIVWNGPVGVFEFDAFGKGTQALARAIAEAPGFSIAGGGDTLAAVDKYAVAEHVSCISTGGGAFLAFLEGKTLPGVAALQARADAP